MEIYTLCLSDYSGNIDPGPGECFPRLGSRLVNPVLQVNCVPDLGRCLLEPGVSPNEPCFVPGELTWDIVKCCQDMMCGST